MRFNTTSSASRRQFLRKAGIASGAGILGASAGCVGALGNAGGGGLKAGVLTMLQLDTGTATVRGAELAAQKVNEEGILDRDLSIVTADTEGESTVAVESYNSLVNREGADLTLGTFAEQTAAAILPEVATAKTMHTNVGAISPALPAKLRQNYEKYKPWFRVSPVNAMFFVVDMVNFAQRFLVEEQGWSSTAFFREDAAWTSEVSGPLKDQFPQIGLEIKDDIVFSLSEQNFSSYLNRIKEMDIDVVWGLVAEAGKAPLLSYEEADVTKPLAGSVVAAQSPAYLSDVNANTSPVITQTFSTWGAKHSSVGKDFVDTYTSQYDTRPSKPTWASFGAYAAIMRWANARAEGGDDLDATITAMENQSFKLTQTYDSYKPGEKAEPIGQTFPHDARYGPGGMEPMWSQWQGGEMKTVFPEKFANADYQSL